jgi:transposase-like protein
VQIALGVGRDGRRQVLAVELAAKESTGTWKTQLLGLKERGLHGVQVVVWACLEKMDTNSGGFDVV